MPKPPASPSGSRDPQKAKTAAKATARNTDSGPASIDASAASDDATQKMAQVESLVAAMPNNPTKAAEHGFANGLKPPAGATAKPASRLPTGSTLTEANGSEKTGSRAVEGLNATIEPLDRVRVDSGGQMLTTN
jgi:catalase